jgi:hypothetical protein
LILWGAVIDSFNPDTPSKEALEIVEKQAIYWICIAVSVFIGCYLFQMILL